MNVFKNLISAFDFVQTNFKSIMKTKNNIYFLLNGKKIFCKIIFEYNNLIIVKSIKPVNEELGFIQTDSQTREIFNL